MSDLLVLQTELVNITNTFDDRVDDLIKKLRSRATILKVPDMDKIFDNINELGFTSLAGAVLYRDHYSIVNLLRNKANPNIACINGRTPLFWAVMNCDIDTTKMLLERGASVSLSDQWGMTPLHFVRGYMNERKNIKIAQLLLASGADPNAQDTNGDTPLGVSFKYGYAGVTKVLLDHGADPTIPNHNGQTAYDLAVSNDYSTVVYLFDQLSTQEK